MTPHVHVPRPLAHGLHLLLVAALSACSGSSHDRASAASEFAQQCSVHNPYRADALGATTVADLATEQRWVRAYVDESYLWYRNVQDVNASDAAYSRDTDGDFLSSLTGYFQALTRKSNPALDHFSFTSSTKAYNQSSQSGVDTSSGALWDLRANTPPRDIRVAYVHPNTPAANAGLQRGDVLVSVNGYLAASDTSTVGIDALNGLLFGSQGAATYTVVVKRAETEQPAVTVATQAMELNPVPATQVLTQPDGSKVGYLLFTDFNAVSEQRLIAAVTQFRDAGVQDLVLDLRYNGGGYVYIANILASMIAGPAQTDGKTFQRFQYNDKRSDETAASARPFTSTTCEPDFNTGRCTRNEALPRLNLSRLYVLTTDNTCSASEAVINGLAGVDVQVQRIGTTTCGKPYGFAAQDNCGLSYFPIEFQIANDKGFGDYANGMAPTCEVQDDDPHALGDPAEAQLAAALTLRSTGSCPASLPAAQARAQHAGAKSATRPAMRPPAYKTGMDGWLPQ